MEKGERLVRELSDLGVLQTQGVDDRFVFNAHRRILLPAKRANRIKRKLLNRSIKKAVQRTIKKL